jgi:hypothetical protein
MNLKDDLNHKVNKEHKGANDVKCSGVVMCELCALCILIEG